MGAGVQLGRLLVPTDQRRETDDEAEDPAGQDEKLGPLGGHDVGVCDGVGHRDVAVQADCDEVQDGGRAHPHVHGQPDGAPNVTKDPDIEHL